MKNKYGFTLVELLAVVIILGILTTIAVPQYTKAIQRSEAANALINLKALYDSAKRYYAANDTWPTSFDGLDTKLLLNTNADGSAIAQNNEWYGTSGYYQYSFYNDKRVSACRITGTLDEDPTGLYCLTAKYTPLTDSPDSYSCYYSNNKYKGLCASLCKDATFTDKRCTIK